MRLKNISLILSALTATVVHIAPALATQVIYDDNQNVTGIQALKIPGEDTALNVNFIYDTSLNIFGNLDPNEFPQYGDLIKYPYFFLDSEGSNAAANAINQTLNQENPIPNSLTSDAPDDFASFYQVPFAFTLGTDPPRILGFGGENLDGSWNLTQFNVDQISDKIVYATFTSVPEPMTILGSVAALGFFTAVKRKQKEKS